MNASLMITYPCQRDMASWKDMFHQSTGVSWGRHEPPGGRAKLDSAAVENEF